MLYNVAEVSSLTNLSKVSIYNKLKLKEMKGHIVKNQGITYVDEEGLNLIKSTLNLKNFDDMALKNPNISTSLNAEIAIDKQDLTIKNDYINYLKAENDRLWQEVRDKSRQIENFQIMLQSEKQSMLQLEAAREEREKKLDTFISEWRQEKTEKRKGFIKRLFNR